jgi:type 1 glutamine amidotransferase/nicotinamidase-related amidase
MEPARPRGRLFADVPFPREVPRMDTTLARTLVRGAAATLFAAVLFAAGDIAADPAMGADGTGKPDNALVMHLRAREESPPGSGQFRPVQQTARWQGAKTAIVVCDMWDRHWCQGATRRVAEMAPRMNEVLAAARQRGVLIIHCPSSCMEAYKDTPMRKLALGAAPVETATPLLRWCHLDKDREGSLPIDDTDGGCDCEPRCPQGNPWRRQIDTLQIAEGDAVTDSAEAFYLMKQRGIENLIVMGVHTNMCVLGRPFSIRQMVRQGQNVVLMRDMTDTMYNSRMRPFVPHVRGTELVVEHIEKFWCPTVASTDFVAGAEFRFAEDKRPHVVFVIGEGEYRTHETLPAFAERELAPRGMACTIVHADPDRENEFPGLAALQSADLLFLSIRRRALPADQLAAIRRHVESGKPVVGIRTASHAFDTRGKHGPGQEEWPEFDHVVLGGNYTGHHGDIPQKSLRAADGAKDHPILHNVAVERMTGNGSLYKVSPLADSAVPLLVGSIAGKPAEPLAWTNSYRGGRVFYTSLGHPNDFEDAGFRQFLVNGVVWAIGKSPSAP